MVQKMSFLHIAIFALLIVDISVLEASTIKASKQKPIAGKVKPVVPKEDETKAVVEDLPMATIVAKPAVVAAEVHQDELEDFDMSKGPAASKKVSVTLTREEDEAAIVLLAETIEKDEENVDNSETAISATTPGFLISRFREVFVQLLRMFGLRTTSSKRKHRTMDMSMDSEMSNNVLEPANYKEEIRTTVGAVLGRPDCIKRAACRAGSYLRDLKGKDIIIVILEKVTPTKWLETIQVVKDSAIHNEECNYKCLED